MAESKFGKHILRGTGVDKSRPGVAAVTPAVMEGPKDWSGIQHRINWKYISQPTLLVEEPHSHDFDEFLVFLGCDPENARDFDAEVELSMGEEGEKHIIDTGTIVCIPKGLVHCPINFKKVGKTVLFCNIYIAPDYVRKPVSG
jgi:mannose-6-phosphate isomerase-like protein (cupin superfamily)